MTVASAPAPPCSPRLSFCRRQKTVSDTAQRPKRKNPILRTRLPTLPPGTRSRVALGLTAAAAYGRFKLQVCEQCGAVQYPPRELCQACLSHRLLWRIQDGSGELLTDTVLRAAQELFFRERLPWRVGLIRLDAGVNVIAYLHARVGAAPCRVRVETALDRAGQAVLVAVPEGGRLDLSDDPRLREFACDPRGRKILVSDGKSRGRPGGGARARGCRRRPDLDRGSRAVEENRRLRGVARAAAGAAGAARPDRRPLGALARRRDRRQGRYRHQHRRLSSHLRHRRAATASKPRSSKWTSIISACCGSLRNSPRR